MGRHDRSYGVWTTKTFRVHRRKSPHLTRDADKRLNNRDDSRSVKRDARWAENVREYIRTHRMGEEMGRNDGNTPKPGGPKPQQPKPSGGKGGKGGGRK